MDDKPEMANQTYTVLGQFPSFPFLKGVCMGQIVCPSEARQAAFLEQQKSLSDQTQQCNLTSSGEKPANSDNVREFQVLKVSSILRHILKYKHKQFSYFFYVV